MNTQAKIAEGSQVTVVDVTKGRFEVMGEAYAGDYQTAQRMQLKRLAIPLPVLKGKRVLDVGCDYGYWSKLASDAGAVQVVGVDRGRYVRGAGYVDLVAQNNAQQWPRCEFVQANLGEEWPGLGEFDVIFCFSLYHHWYPEARGHALIWQWLEQHTAPYGMLLWEGPVDTRDPIARKCVRGIGGYDRVTIMAAAQVHYEVEVIGPALHKPHREVWRCLSRRGMSVSANSRACVQGSGQGKGSIQGSADERSARHDGVVPIPRNTECTSREAARDHQQVTAAITRDGTRDTNRATPVVERKVRAARPDKCRGAPRAWCGDPDALLRVRSAVVAEDVDRAEERRSNLFHPEWAIVLGGAAGVWDDVLAWEEVYGKQWDGMVVAANDVGSHWPRYLDHWCTLHPERMAPWKDKRAAHGFVGGYITWGRRKRELDIQVRPWAGGSSGMLAIQVAQMAGAERVVLCGVPMTPTPHFEESVVHSKTKNWMAVAGHWRAWTKHMSKMMGLARSMSGRTAEVLGVPTLEWLTEGEAVE